MLPLATLFSALKRPLHPNPSPKPVMDKPAPTIPPLDIVYPVYDARLIPSAVATARRVPGMVAILNVDSGPGARKATGWEQGARSLEAAGAVVLGYIDWVDQTDQQQPISHDGLALQVKRWREWYNVKGIFGDDLFDWTEEREAALIHLRSCVSGPLWANCGTAADVRYRAHCDVLCDWEKRGMPSKPARPNTCRIGFLDKAGDDPAPLVRQARRDLVRYVYVTDRKDRRNKPDFQNKPTRMDDLISAVLATRNNP